MHIFALHIMYSPALFQHRYSQQNYSSYVKPYDLAPNHKQDAASVNYVSFIVARGHKAKLLWDRNW